jgi:formylglycine-generating enzyme required for sulfatase activity
LSQDYCHWLGEKTGLPLDLPTEAQWEYAARNRGGYVLFATDNGNYEIGKNIANNEQKIHFSGLPLFSFIIGKFPPTPLGLYDMAGNGVDWINDWYAEDYYSRSQKSTHKALTQANIKSSEDILVEEVLLPIRPYIASLSDQILIKKKVALCPYITSVVLLINNNSIRGANE